MIISGSDLRKITSPNEATLAIKDSDGNLSALISARVEFDRSTGKWHAYDEAGNHALDDVQSTALLRVLTMRLDPRPECYR